MRKPHIIPEVMWGLVFPIIPYQVITGNYSKKGGRCYPAAIIPYQVITGNYSIIPAVGVFHLIIPYQVITGNYSVVYQFQAHLQLYHTK